VLYSSTYRCRNDKIKSLTILIILIVALVVSSVAFVGLIPQAEADGDVVILSHTIYQTWGFPPFSVSKGDYQVAGEVQNVGAQALHFNVTGEFYDSNNEIVGTSFLIDTLPDWAPSYLHVVLPGKKSPFTVYLSRFDEETGDFRSVDHYSLKVTTSPANLYQSGFEILSQSSHEIAGSGIFIEGEIKNIGTEYVDGFLVFATFYNETGEVVAVAPGGGAYAGQGGFPPNQTAYFSTKLDEFQDGGRLQRVDRYELTAEGYDYSLWTVDGQLIDPEIVYVLGSVPKQEEESPKQPENSPIALYVAIAAIVAILLISTLLILRKRRGGKNKIGQ
jgi:hypothetical protein